MLEFIDGHIAITQSGARILIWPDEGGDPECFTGELLRPEGERAHISDLSVYWDRSKVVRIEAPPLPNSLGPEC